MHRARLALAALAVSTLIVAFADSDTCSTAAGDSGSSVDTIAGKYSSAETIAGKDSSATPVVESSLQPDASGASILSADFSMDQARGGHLRFASTSQNDTAAAAPLQLAGDRGVALPSPPQGAAPAAQAQPGAPTEPAGNAAAGTPAGGTTTASPGGSTAVPVSAPAPPLQIHNIILPALNYWTDALPAGFVRTVKTVRTERQGSLVTNTIQVSYYRRPYHPLPVSYIEIPAIGLRARMVEGVTQRAMSYGPGHFPGMALPGEIGNCGIAAHSNVPGCDYFHYLYRLRPGMHIFLDTISDVYDYTITDMHVVHPENTRDLLPTTYRRLTLVTCTLPGGQDRLIVVAVGSRSENAIALNSSGSTPSRLPLAGAGGR